MEVRYYLDADGQPHIYGHDVSEAEVEDLLDAPEQQLPAKNGATAALGQAANGRYLKVIYAPDADGLGVFVITAYELRGKELKAFRRWRRRRN